MSRQTLNLYFYIHTIFTVISCPGSILMRTSVTLSWSKSITSMSKTWFWNPSTTAFPNACLVQVLYVPWLDGEGLPEGHCSIVKFKCDWSNSATCNIVAHRCSTVSNFKIKVKPKILKKGKWWNNNNNKVFGSIASIKCILYWCQIEHALK